ncbi:DUF461 domain-containing protein [Streptomyces gobiensis]|uniref:DUF461 domain-containing protein n=1 Tax=Streptomyces gobiensis TaxID=2875706 RepID=UPI001E604C50|nr:DUF461 domain-containing protein [Streptomyces gobiensis]UGY92138.1 DUF461 domain-containing protein [Streptomyces gobiensis]
MSSTLRRGAIAATVIALSTLSLAACGAGTDAQTNGVNPNNASISVGDIKIQNVNIVTSRNADGPAAVSARIFNDGTEDETLRAVTISGSGGPVTLAPARGGDLTIPAGGSLMLGGKDNPSAVINDARGKGIRDGNAQPITFELSSTGKVKIRATVVPVGGAYAEYGATPDPLRRGEQVAPERSPAPETTPESPGEPGTH